MLELFLAIAVGSLVYNIHNIVKVKKKVRLLESNNEVLSEAMLLPPSDTNYIPHTWIYVSSDPIYYSSFSMKEVKLVTEKCNKCGLVHRYISQGYPLAQKEGLTSAEGFYKNGIKVSECSCYK